MSHPNDYDFYCEVALQPNALIEKVYENEQVLAFYHTKPCFESHIIVVPKKHVQDLRYVSPALLHELMTIVQKIISDLPESAIQSGVQVVTNLGSRQDTPHLHFHVGIGQKIQ